VRDRRPCAGAMSAAEPTRGAMPMTSRRFKRAKGTRSRGVSVPAPRSQQRSPSLELQQPARLLLPAVTLSTRSRSQPMSRGRKAAAAGTGSSSTATGPASMPALTAHTAAPPHPPTALSPGRNRATSCSSTEFSRAICPVRLRAHRACVLWSLCRDVPAGLPETYRIFRLGRNRPQQRHRAGAVAP
jgi:hypothetical protein